MKNTTRQNMLRLHCKIALAMALCAAAFSQPCLAQVPPASILQIDVANNVLYNEDASDVTKFATNPNATADTHSAKTSTAAWASPTLWPSMASRDGDSCSLRRER